MPDGAIEQWSYDGNGNTTACTNPLTQVIGYLYDEASRLWKVDYPTGTDTVLTYDNADRLTQMVDATGTTNWRWSATNR